MIKNSLKKCISLCLIAVMTISISGCGNTKIPELIAPQAQAKININPSRGTIEDELVIETRFVPRIYSVEAALSSDAYNINYKLGDEVKKDSLVFSVNSTYESDVKNTSANLELLKQSNEYMITAHGSEIKRLQEEANSLIGFERENLMLDIDITKIKYEREEKENKEKYEELSESYKSLLEAKDNLSVYAPIDGIISFIEVSKDGDTVNKGDVVLEIADLTDIYLETDYIEDNIISNMSSLSIMINGKEYTDYEFIPYTDEELAEINAFGLDKKTFFRVNNLDENISCGDIAIITIKYNTIDNCLFIPSDAVITDKQTKEKYVFTYNDKNKLVKTVIETGKETADKTEILSGITENDLVYYMDDQLPYGIETKEFEVISGDFNLVKTYKGAEKRSDSTVEVKVKCPFFISQMYFNSNETVAIEKGTAVMAITPIMSELDIEKARNNYKTVVENNKLSLEQMDDDIAKYLSMSTKGETILDRAQAKYNYNQAMEGYNDFKESLEKSEKEALLLKQYADAAAEGQTVDIYAENDGIFKYNDQAALLVDVKKYSENTTIGYVEDPNSYLLYINDTDLITGQNGYIGYLNKITVTDNINTLSATAIKTSNGNGSEYVIAKFDDSENIIDLASKQLIVTQDYLTVSNATLIDKNFVYTETINDIPVNYVYLKYDGGAIKKYIDVNTETNKTMNYYWVKSGLNPGDICITKNN